METAEAFIALLERMAHDEECRAFTFGRDSINGSQASQLARGYRNAAQLLRATVVLVARVG